MPTETPIVGAAVSPPSAADDQPTPPTSAQILPPAYIAARVKVLAEMAALEAKRGPLNREMVDLGRALVVCFNETVGPELADLVENLEPASCRVDGAVVTPCGELEQAALRRLKCQSDLDRVGIYRVVRLDSKGAVVLRIYELLGHGTAKVVRPRTVATKDALLRFCPFCGTCLVAPYFLADRRWAVDAARLEQGDDAQDDPPSPTSRRRTDHR